MAEDANGDLWFAAVNIYRYSKRTNSWTLFKSNEIGLGEARHVAIGQNQDIWVGTREGLGRYELASDQWTVYTTQNGLPANSIGSVFQDSTGGMWTGVEQVGLFFSDEPGTKWNQMNAPDDLIGFGIYSIFEDKRGNLWIDSSLGLHRFNPESQSWTGFRVSRLGESTVVTSIAEDTDGALWLGTFTGAKRFQPDTGEWEEFNTSHGLINNHVWAVSVDRKGNVWFGTEAGASRYNPPTNKWMSYNEENGFSKFLTRDILVDGEGRVWFGTSNGVYRHNP
jgi:ligand-binding sensor domain-containing protein